MIKRQVSALSSVFLSLMLLGAALAQQLDAETRSITVSPSGSDDTAALQAALDSCVAFGPGCTVQLTEGIFQSTQLLVHNFKGSFRGAGQDKTILEPFGIFPASLDALERPPSPDNPWPHHVIFVDSDVVVSNLTFRMTESKPVQPWSIFGMNVTAMISSLLITGSEATATVEGNSFVGAEGSFEGFNMINGMYIEGVIPDDAGIESTGYGTRVPLMGQFIIRDNRFKQVLSGSPLSNLVDSQVLITGNRYEQGSLSMDLSDLNGSSVEVRDNDITDMAYAGIEILSGRLWRPERSSIYYLQGNSVSTTGAFAVSLVDMGEVKTLRAVVSDNRLELADGVAAVAGNGAHHAVIMGNTLHGTAAHAFTLGVAPDAGSPAPSATGWVISGNDLSGLSTSDAAVMLGEGSANTTVVCSSSATVMDAGTSNTVLCD